MPQHARSTISTSRQVRRARAHLGQVLGGEQDAQAALQHLGDGPARVAAHRLDALGVKGGARLAGRLVRKPHVALLGQQDARVVHLSQARRSSRQPSEHSLMITQASSNVE